MNLDRNTSTNKANETGSYRPSPALLALLEARIKFTEDFRKNLKPKYDISVYLEFEEVFNNLRYELKSKSVLKSDPDHLFIQHSELRRTAMEEILTCATDVAERFQDAREQNRLDHPRCKDALENLILALRNLKFLSENAR